MASAMGKEGVFQPPQAAQAQAKPGLEKNMAPASEATKLESSGTFVEYVGSGKLKDKKALITGGDSGIGRSVAVLMAREGADVTIVYLPEEEEDAQDTKKMVESEGRSCHLFGGNLANRETCHKAVEEHMSTYKKLNILVNNASKQYMCKDLAQIDLDNVTDTFESNIIQMFAVTKFALPHLSKGDSIINTTSTVAFRGTSGMVDYSATKGAIVSFTRSLSAQLKPKGIRVNAVAPGPVYTPIQVDTREAEEMENFGSGSSIGRPGQPSEVATSFIFLASADASLFYGQVLHCYPLGD
ncbi:oxidoreductase [Aspergillus sclerotiicarbonarius CBS 121057]|uniref:Oxidoreductase n=1 Tax=Aspergillus sclerotiicarbonarius (strain CBS 121057 / IBT 28362) TaxID=1448318 RepID=A0A319F8G8_ASPSB|nr:oxidoreductase [Aspergillus sclerotiicarbonarius CBS 121057]